MDWREITSWYPIERIIFGASSIVRGITQYELLDMGNDLWPGWHWYPGIEGSIHNWVAQRHDIEKWFIWDPGIGVNMPSQLIDMDCSRASNLGAGGFVIFPFLVSLMMQSGWTSRVSEIQVTRARLHHQWALLLLKLAGVLRGNPKGTTTRSRVTMEQEPTITSAKDSFSLHTFTDGRRLCNRGNH